MDSHTEQLKNNKEIALAVSTSIMNGNWKELDNLLDPSFTYTGDGFVFTKDEYIGFMQDMKSAFSNLNMTFPAIIAEGDMVSIRFISTAVNTGSFMGAPANKKNLEVHGIFMRKIHDGKVIQEWQTTDLLGVMKQIGFGALMGYSVFVGLFKVKQKRPMRKDK
jgi:predicted ester cyclase